MALGDIYATLAELKTYLSIADTVDDARLNDALESTSRGIEKVCRRQFNRADTATARVFTMDTCGVVDVDDFYTTTGLVIRSVGEDGTPGDPWLASEYILEPRNGVVDGEDGWPYSRVIVGGFHHFHRRREMEVTAAWGWSAVPAPVHQACLIIAAETFKLADAPFGVAGFADWGMIRVRDNPIALSKLAPYRRDPVLVA